MTTTGERVRPAAAPAVAPVTAPRAWWRQGSAGTAVAIVLTTVLLSLALTAGALVWAAITDGGLTLRGLAGIALLAAGVFATIALQAGILRLATGRLHPVIALTAFVTGVVLLAATSARIGDLPLLWVPALSVDATPVVVAALVASALGVLLGPGWARVLGAVAASAIVVVLAVPSLTTEAAAPAAAARFAEREARFETAVAGALPPMTVDLATVAVDRVDGGAERSRTWLRTPGGTILEVQARTSPPAAGDPRGCLPLRAPAERIGDAAAWCRWDDDGWGRIDGLGAARTIDGLLVVVVAPTGSEATVAPSDIATVLEALRPMTDAEFRGYARAAFDRTAPAP